MKMSCIALVLALIGTLLAPLSLAAETDTTTVTGQISTYYTITAPENFTMAITPGAGGNSGNKTLSVETNDSGNFYLTIDVKENAGDGCLSGSGGTLSSALVISGTGLTSVTLSGENQTLIERTSLSGTPKSWSVSDLVITQPPFNSMPPGNYTATITFTATFPY